MGNFIWKWISCVTMIGWKKTNRKYPLCKAPKVNQFWLFNVIWPQHWLLCWKLPFENLCSIKHACICCWIDNCILEVVTKMIPKVVKVYYTKIDHSYSRLSKLIFLQFKEGFIKLKFSDCLSQMYVQYDKIVQWSRSKLESFEVVQLECLVIKIGDRKNNFINSKIERPVVTQKT